MMKAGTFPKVILAIFVACVLGLVLNLRSARAFEYHDPFTEDPTNKYTWLHLSDFNSYTYDSENEEVWIEILYAQETGSLEEVWLQKQFTDLIEGYADSLIEGYLEIRFKPSGIFHRDGSVWIKMFSSSNPEDYYEFRISIENPEDPGGPRTITSLIKSVNGRQVVTLTFSPTPQEYEYLLDAWNAMALSFSPTTVAGYLRKGDGPLQQVLPQPDDPSGGTDPKANSIEVDTMEIIFKQQSQYLDDIRLTGVPAPIVLATVDIKPDTLEEFRGATEDKAKCCIVLSEGYNGRDVDVNTVMLNDTVQADQWTNRRDCDGDGVKQDLEVRFDMSAVQEVVEEILAAREQPQPKPLVVRFRDFFAKLVSPQTFKPLEEEEKAVKLEVRKPGLLKPLAPTFVPIARGVGLTVTGKVSGQKFAGTDTLLE